MILRAAALILALATAACTGATGGGEELPGRGEYIVYSVSPSVQSAKQMFRIRPDGTQKLAMTNPEQGSNGDPAFNSDGNTIVFSSSRDQPNPSSFGAATHLYKTDINAGIQTRVTANPLSCAERGGHFSPDDRMIVFVMRCDTPIVEQVFRINADGSGQVRVVADHPALAAPHSEIFAAFGPNNRIAFAADLSGNAIGNPQPAMVDLFAMDVDGKNTQRLTDLAPEGRTIVDRLSVSGATVYFVTARAGDLSNAQLEAIRFDGTGRTVLYRIPDISASGGRPFPQDSQFAPSPNGASITFVRHDLASGKDVLMTALADGTSASAIDASGIATAPAWK